MIDLRRRASDEELLDAGVPDDEARRILADLRFVNRWLGGRRSLLRAVGPFLRGAERPRLLDVGCGSADLPAAVVRQSGGRVLAVGVDLKLPHLREAPPDVRRVVADAARLPFAARSFEVVTVSLFLHHIDPPDVPPLLRGLFDLARRALVVNDLRRALVPYLFGRATFPLLFQSRVSVNDGLVSIRRGFTRDELAAAFADAGIEGVRVVRRFPYRLVAVAEKK